jgi:hypothetical protein
MTKKVANDERLEKLEIFGSGYQLLTEALGQFPQGMWGYKPANGGWSIHEIAVHIADSETLGYVRFRKCIAESGQGAPGYNGDAWAAQLHYQDQSVLEALEQFRWLRLRTYKLLQGLEDAVWANTFEHPQRGKLTLEQVLAIYANHIPDHVEQMWAVYREWVAEQW